MWWRKLHWPLRISSLSVEFQGHGLLLIVFHPKWGITVLLSTPVQLWGFSQAWWMIRSWTVPPVRRAMHWTSSGTSTTSIHAHTSYLYLTTYILSLTFCFLLTPPAQVWCAQLRPDFSVFSVALWRAHFWFTVAYPDHQWAAHTRGICGASYYSWSLKMAKIFSPSFLLVLHLSYFLGIFGIFHPKWLKYYKDTFISLHM